MNSRIRGSGSRVADELRPRPQAGGLPGDKAYRMGSRTDTQAATGRCRVDRVHHPDGVIVAER